MFLTLAGAYDTRQPGVCLFPETLRPELREVRSVIEAYSRSSKLEDVAQGTASGIELARPLTIRAHLRGGVAALYTLDRVE